jgi:hypothetical protein
MKRRLRAPSPALVVSLVALFVALGGTTYAATSLPKNSVGTAQLKKNAVTSAKIKDGSVTAGKVDTAGLTVPNALHAKSADSATKATNATNATHATSANTAASATTATSANSATTAGSATNALSLGGIPASGYTRNDCNSLTGQVKGFAYVPSSSSFSSTLADLPNAYNCSGEAVQARRIVIGKYEVKFLGSPVTIALATVQTPMNSLVAFATVQDLGSGDFEVTIFNPSLNGGAGGIEDDPFAIVTP